MVEKKWEYNEAVHQLIIHFKKPKDTVRKEDLYNIVIELSISMKSVRVVKHTAEYRQARICVTCVL